MATVPPPALRLLIVDDDEQLRQTLERRFKRQGLAVTAAADGEEALAKAAHSRWDVALLDLHLPGMNGIELLDKLKELQPELEALLLTAHGSIETAIQAMKHGRLRLPDQAVPPARAGGPHPEGLREGPAGPPRAAVGRAGRATSRPATGWSAPARPCSGSCS